MDKILRKARKSRSFGAQRVNVGLTGLAAIFLIVVSAAAGVRSARPAAHVDPKAETLAVLGVAPSSGSDATLSKQAPPPRVARRDPKTN